MAANLGKNIAADLAFVWDQCEVPRKVQHKCMEAGYETSRMFRRAAVDEAGLRALMKQHFSMDADTSLEASATIAALVDAWHTCRDAQTIEAQVRKEARMTGRATSLETHERESMLKVVVKSRPEQCPIPEDRQPHAVYIQKNFNEVN